MEGNAAVIHREPQLTRFVFLPDVFLKPSVKSLAYCQTQSICKGLKEEEFEKRAICLFILVSLSILRGQAPAEEQQNTSSP